MISFVIQKIDKNQVNKLDLKKLKELLMLQIQIIIHMIRN